MTDGPAAFFSYVRFDDQHESGRLSEFCQRLAGEVRVQTGEDFHIFQDRKDIAWGQQWKGRLEQSIDTVTFLIPILTPGFFKSEYCRAELQGFLEREKRLGRDDLVLPVHYVNCPALADPARRSADPLLATIAARQLADWRELRFEPFTSPQVGRMLAWLAQQIVAAKDRGVPWTTPAGCAPSLDDMAELEGPDPIQTSSPAVAAATRAAYAEPAPRSEPPTIIVDARHGGDFATLAQGVSAARPGDRILVRPGLYQEGLVIDKSIEIIGDGDASDIVIEAAERDVILFHASMGRISNLTLRQIGGELWHCVLIAQGRLDLEQCDLSSQSLACIAIRSGADPRVRGNRIHHGRQGGVLVSESALGTLEDNDIYANAMAGVEIQTGANPIVRRNRIHDGKAGGVHVTRNGLGTLEDNDIFGNAFAGVSIQEHGNPLLQRNRIRGGRQGGVFVHAGGKGTLEGNEIFGNAFSGIEIKTDGSLLVRRNRVTQNGGAGVVVRKRGSGVFEDNDLRFNGKGAWEVSPDCAALVQRARNLE